MASLSDILTTIQQGVTAINNFGVQLKGSLLNIQSQISSITGSAITAISGGTGISVTGPSSAKIVTNTGVTGIIAGAGLSVNSSVGTVTVANTGVLSLTAGSNITITGSSNTPTIAASPANSQNVLPNVNWQLWSAHTFMNKRTAAGTSNYPIIAFNDPGGQSGNPTLTAVGGATTPFAVGDIAILSRVSGGQFNYWGYPGTGYANATMIGARITAVTSNQITLQAPLNAVSPIAATQWNVEVIGIGDFANSGQGPDGWAKTGSLNIWADDFAVNQCPGAIRVLGMSKGITGTEDVYWQSSPNQLRHAQGRTVTFGAIVWQKVQQGAGTWRVFVYDDVNGATTSVFGTGSGTGYQFLSVTATIATNCTAFRVGIETAGNSGDVYYMALPTLVFGASLSQAACAQNVYDYIPATAHWNPPILLGTQFNFPTTEIIPASGLYAINNIDIEAISLCQCHKSAQLLVCKVEWTTAVPGAYIFAGNNVNAGGAGPTTQSLKFGPQAGTIVSSLPVVGQGTIPLWYDGTFCLFTNSSQGLPGATNTWDFWDVIGSTPYSLN